MASRKLLRDEARAISLALADVSDIVGKARKIAIEGQVDEQGLMALERALWDARRLQEDIEGLIEFAKMQYRVNKLKEAEIRWRQGDAI